MRPEFFIIATMLGWALGSFWYKLASATISPIMLNSVALALYMVLMPCIWLTVKFDHSLTWSGVIYTLVGSLFMCIGTLGFSYALRSGAPVGQVTIMTSLYPALTLGLSMMFLGETLTIKKGIGIVLALISFAVLSSK
jgi:bacterial/archaeal transporter family protein